MITAVDSSVVFDVLVQDSRFFESAVGSLAAMGGEGALVACATVWAEVGAFFESPSAIADYMEIMDIQFVPLNVEAALAAAAAWRAYRHRGGTRDRLMPDFLVGAHALLQADRLLTRDAAFQRRNYPSLVVVDPTEPADRA
jgi:predicted nucleic acid-binding protein